MADLSYTVEAKGVEDVDKLVVSLDKLHGVLSTAKGSGKALEEMRRIMLGFKGQGSVFEDLYKAVNGMNSAIKQIPATMQGVAQSFEQTFIRMTKRLETEAKVASATVRNEMLEAASAIPKGMDSALAETGQVVNRRMRTIAAQAKAEATKLYEAMVMRNPNQRVTQRGLEALVQYSEAGATLSPYHKSLVDGWKRSSAMANKAIADMEKEGARQLEANLNATTAAIKAQVAAATSSAKGMYTSLRGDGSAGEVVNSWQTQTKDFVTTLRQRNSAIDSLNKQRNAQDKLQHDALMRQLTAEAAQKEAFYRDRDSKIATLGAAKLQGLKAGISPSMVGGEFTTLPKNFFGDMKKGKESADNLGLSFKDLSKHSNDLHSAARGLASGFNLLWLTWGNLGPMFIGAAISNSFLKTAREGIKVANTMEIIGSLGGATASELSQLNQELVRIGYSGIHGPLEASEAMKTLVLAGLEANKVLAVTQTVLNFSLAGTTSLQVAADTLVSITTAFGTGAAGFEESSDIIVKAAADSKASVESIAEAMKTASVVGEQYKASQVDVALLLEYLANVGIQGSAAGTAVRNMFADITGRSGQVQKVLKSLGLDFKSASGGVIDLYDQMVQLRDVLSKYDAKSQANIFQAIYGERGAKAAIAAWQAFNTAAKDSSKGANKLQEDLRALGDAAGISAIEAAKMSQSTENMFKKVSSAMETTMYRAYQAMEPYLYQIAVDLQAAFANPATFAALETLVTAIARFGVALSDNIGLISSVAALWAGLKIASLAIIGGLNLWTAAAARLTVAKTADVAVTAAQIAEEQTLGRVRTANAAKDALDTAGKLKGLAKVAQVLPVIGNLLSLGIGLWTVYDAVMGNAGKAAEDYSDNKAQGVIDALRKENEHIEAVNKLRREGLTLMEAEARIKAVNAESDVNRGFLTKTDKLRSDIDALTVEYNKVKKRGQAKDDQYLAELDAQRLGLGKELVDAIDKQTDATRRLRAEEKRRQDNARDSAELAKKEAARINVPTGNLTWDLLGAGGKGKGKGPFEIADVKDSGAYKALLAETENLFKVTKDSYDKRKRLADLYRQNELMSEADYFVQSFNMASAYEASQLATLERQNEDYKKLYEERNSYLTPEMGKVKGDVARQKYIDAIKKEDNDLKAFQEKNQAEVEKILTESFARIETVYATVAGTAAKLVKADKEFWATRAEKTKAANAAEDLERAYNNINDSIFSSEKAQYAAAKAQAAVNAEVDQHLVKLREALKLQEETLQAQMALYESELATASNEKVEAMARTIMVLSNGIASIRKTLADAVGNGAIEGATAASRAFESMRREQGIALRNELADTVVDGLTDKGAEAGKKLRAMLQRELLIKPLTVAVRGILEGVSGSISSFLGGGAKASGSGTGGMSDMFSLTNDSQGTMGFRVGNWMSNAGGNMNGAIGDTISSLGNTIKDLDAWLKDIPGMSGGIGSAAGYLGSIYALTQGQVGTGLGSAIGTAILPGIGTMVGGALGGLVDSLFGGDDIPRYAATAQYSGGVTSKGWTPGDQWNDALYPAVEALASGIGKALDTTAETFGQTAGYELFASFSKDAENKGVFGALNITGPDGKSLVDWSQYDTKWGGRHFSDGDAGEKEFMAAITADVKTAFQSMDIPTWSKQLINAAENIDGINAALQQIGTVKAVFDGLGKSMEMFTGISGELQTQLLSVSGGIDALASNAGAFYEGFYSEQERMDILARNLRSATESFGVALDPSLGDKAKEQFRKAVEDAMAAGQGELVAALLGISGSFAQAADYAQKALEELDDTLTKLKTSAEIADKMFQLENEWLRANGLEVQAVNRERAKELEALAAYGDAAVELQQKIWALNDANKLAETSAKELMAQTKQLADAYAKTASAASAARDKAGSLLDKINEAMGGTGDTYSKLREQRLWDAMATASYKQQIDLAEELTTIVIERANVEKQTAQKMIDMSRKIQESIDSMKLGELSPLTLEQKLAESIRQFNEQIEKAKGGDVEAAQKAIDLRSTLLGLGQRYYAASDLYTELFNSTELSLQSIAGMYQSQGDAQSAISQASLAELGNLRAILEAAYAQAELDYAESSVGLKEQLEKLASMDGGISLVADILGGLPVELAAALQPLMQSYTDSQVAWFMRDLQMQNPGMMLSDLQSSALANGATASQVSNVSGKLYSDAEVKSLYLAGKQNYPYYTDSQLVNLAAAQYGIPAEQAWRVINGSHANGLSYVPYNNYVANLHQGELVLPERQASIFRSMEPAFESMANNSNDEVVVLLNNILERIGNTAEIDSANAAMLASVIEDSSQRTERAIVKGVRASGNTGVTK